MLQDKFVWVTIHALSWYTVLLAILLVLRIAANRILQRHEDTGRITPADRPIFEKQADRYVYGAMVVGLVVLWLLSYLINFH